MTSLNGTQHVTPGAVFNSYSTSGNDITVAVTPDDGYSIQSYILNGTKFGGADLSGPNAPLHLTGVQPFDLGNATGGDKSFSVVFSPDAESVTASITAGSVTPTRLGNVYYGYSLPTAQKFTFSPALGCAIQRIDNVPAGATVEPANGATAGNGINGRVTVTLPAGFTFKAPLAMLAQVSANLTPSIAQIAPQNYVVSDSRGVSISATASNFNGTPTYSWTYLSGPKNGLTYNTSGGKLSGTNGTAYTITPLPAIAGFPATGSSVTFATPAVAGQYKFQVSVTDGSTTKTAIAAVNVLAQAADAASQCQACHSANNLATVADTSSHASCQSCHYGGTGHPGTVSAITVSPASYVVGMDNVVNGNGTAAPQGTNFCASCHGVTGNPAQAVPTLTTHQDKLCSDCHSSAHQTHVASAACQACHAAVHTAAAMGNKACLDCHNGHSPKIGTQPLVGGLSSHPAVTLYTFEEIGMQMAGGQKVPVQVDASGKGLPYSPKQTCGSTAGCHVKNGADYSYDKISDTAFHSHEGRAEMMDLNNGNLLPGLHIPWVQSTAMVGKW
jgi:hypothetical protein